MEPWAWGVKKKLKKVSWNLMSLWMFYYSLNAKQLFVIVNFGIALFTGKIWMKDFFIFRTFCLGNFAWQDTLIKVWQALSANEPWFLQGKCGIFNLIKCGYCLLTIVVKHDPSSCLGNFSYSNVLHHGFSLNIIEDFQFTFNFSPKRKKKFQPNLLHILTCCSCN